METRTEESDRKWSVGRVLKSVREEQNISQLQLCRGLCSLAALSRIESGAREMDYFLCSRIFERLGYAPDLYEFYGSTKDLEQWEQRYVIQLDLAENNYGQLETHLDAYEACWKEELEKDSLQLQFTEFHKGMLLINKGCSGEGAALLKKAILRTVPDWHESNQMLILGKTELYMMNAWGDACAAQGQREEAFRIYTEILHSLQKRQRSKETMSRLYSEIVCKTASVCWDQGRYITIYETCQDALEVLSKCLQITNWPELLYWKGRSLEAIQKVCSRQTSEAFQLYVRSYYGYRLMGQEDMAEKIKVHLEERYGWECTT